MPPPSPPKPTTFPSLFNIIKSPSPKSNPSIYTTTFSDDFCIGTVPNGGYITSAFHLIAKHHMNQTHPTLPCPDPINIHLQFLRRTAVGPATFLVHDVKLGKRISNLHITLRQHLDPSHPEAEGKMQDEVQGYIVLSDLMSETGPSHDTRYRLLPEPMSVDLSSLAANSDANYIRRRADPYGVFRRASLNCEMYLVKPHRRPEDHTPAIADQWVRFTPMDREGSTRSLARDLKDGNVVFREGRWTNEALGFLVDIFPQLNERFVNAEVEDALLRGEREVSDGEIQRMVRASRTDASASASASQDGADEPPRTYWYPTLLLNLDVKRKLPDEGVEWLFVRVQAKRIHGGRFDLSVEVWCPGLEGEEGEMGMGLVAISTHASLVLDAGRNMNRKGKRKDQGRDEDKDKKGADVKRESKI